MTILNIDDELVVGQTDKATAFFEAEARKLAPKSGRSFDFLITPRTIQATNRGGDDVLNDFSLDAPIAQQIAFVHALYITAMHAAHGSYVREQHHDSVFYHIYIHGDDTPSQNDFGPRVRRRDHGGAAPSPDKRDHDEEPRRRVIRRMGRSPKA